jgi:hypothetical protein
MGNETTETTVKKTVPFQSKGENEVLAGYIYDCASYSNGADAFISTTAKIANFAGKEYEYGADIRQAIDDLAKPKIPLPKKENYIDDGADAEVGKIFFTRCQPRKSSGSTLSTTTSVGYTL